MVQDTESIGTLFGEVTADAKAYASAEVAYWREFGAAKLREAKTGVIFAVAALVLLHMAVIALAVGLVLMLAPMVGPALATLIVVVALAALAGLFGWLAARHFAGTGK